MSEVIEFKRGPGGRPTRAEAERRHAALLETAMRLFLERGYEPVSVEEIAKQAGVAKRFIYARYADKAALFVAAVEHNFQGRMEALHAIEPSPRGPEWGLHELARALLEMTLQPDALALHRLFMSAAPQFPDLVKRMVDRKRQSGIKEIERVLQFYADRGEIGLHDPQWLTEQFFISTIGIPQRLALAGIRETPYEEARRLRLAVNLFVNGCRARPTEKSSSSSMS
jgi:TetR/AcrR family transcriptional regulator, mexJK operon transcriptional repressor